jgi:hypothetical protein
MCHPLLGDARLFTVLLKIDFDLAAMARTQGCAQCGGPVHCANYPRKPRGGPAGLSDADCLRLSFCCAREGCRSRNTPPSVRFLGRSTGPYWRSSGAASGIAGWSATSVPIPDLTP